MSDDTRQRIIALHAIYIQLTGLTLPLDMHRESVWYEWQRRGHGERELRDVVAHIRQGIASQRRNPGALKFSNLIGQPDYFEEDLAEARAMARARSARHQGAKAVALRSTGREICVQKTEARTAAEIIAAEKAFENFRALKGKL
jgi:hypothetical protein